ncbi:amino acid adenylation domain-containing protein [Pseudomonas sp. CAU 1711]|uniref:amino acid adenylation domain-containing protein n=1 Tax=Pseudomonas sp. CAU 1711 TaxID=3140356 RepID=UPI003260381B
MSQLPVEGFRPSLQQVRHWRSNQGGECAWLCIAPPAEIGAEALRHALQQLLARHEILRTRLTAVPGLQLPVQVIAEHLDFAWLEVESRDRPSVLAELGDRVRQADGPTLAAALLGAGAQRQLLVVLPAANVDGASLERFTSELAQLCQGQPLDDEPVQHADFAEWQHELSEDPESAVGRGFWQRQWAEELRVVAHPFENGRSDQPCQPARIDHTLPDAEQDRLLSALAALGLPPARLFGLCWAALLQRHLGLPRLLLGWSQDGRNEATRTALGPYAKQLPLQLAFDENKSLPALAKALAALLDEAEAYQESWPGNAGTLPFAFDYRTVATGPWQELEIGLPGRPGTLQLEVREQAGCFEFRLHYDAARLDERAARLVLDQFLTLTDQALAAPQRPLREADALGAAQRAWLAELNRTQADLPGPALLHQLFEAQAERHPDALALVAGATRLGYRELNVRANRLAHRLLAEGLQPGQPVGLFLGRGAEAIVAILAILKAGGAYLPLDPGYPGERLADMLAQTRAPLLLSLRALQDKLPAGDYRPLWLDEPDNGAEHNPNLALHPEQLAYLIFTSGSTGRPKGVMVAHRNAVHSTRARWQGYREALDAFLLVSGLSFDSSVAGLFWTLSQGGTLCLPQDGEVQDAAALARLIAGQGISHTLMLPSLYAQLLEQPDALASLRCTIVAGEACQAAVAARHAQACPQAALHNEYGPTEGSVWCSLYRAHGEERGVLPIGRPIANMQLWVLDERLRPLAPGVAGEIYLSGAGITQGYLDRPALTAERFLPDPFGGDGGRLYRSGDIGRWNARGELEFLGRVDHQVKIRGFRIELGEIEACLLEHPALREAAVVARPDPGGDAQLVAYVVACDACPGGQALGEHLAARLPAHMLPAAYVMLPALPLTPNGKLDRYALPAPERASQRPYREPRSAREAQVAALWAEVLGVERVGLDDHFFELGGHSLTATRLISRLRSALGLEVPVRALFQQPTLQAFLDRALPAAGAPALPAIQPAPRDGALPLSHAQQRLWLFDRLHPGSTAYHVAEAVQLSGALDQQALQRSFTELLRRHESLRTTFHLEGDRPLQRIQPPRPVSLPLLDLSPLDEAARERELRSQLDALALQPFDLARGPLLRAGLIRLGAERHVLWLCLHHIVTDGWSMRVLVRELEALYLAFSQGQPSPLAEPSLQYADYAHWQRSRLDAEALKPQLDFWLAHLGESRQPLRLPGMRPRPALLDHRGAQHEFLLDAQLLERLRAFCQARGLTLYMATLAAFQVLLGAHSGQRELRIGIPVAGRQRQELEGLVGFFVNTLALRADLSGDPSGDSLLEQVRDNLLAAQAHQELPYEQLLQALPAAQGVPLVQVMFDLHQERILGSRQFAGLAIEPLEEGSTQGTLFDLMLDIGEREHGLVCTFTYSTQLFEAGYIARLAEDYRLLLQALLAEPQARLSALCERLPPLPPALATSQVDVEAVLRELLERERLDLGASFFELGGTSLKAVQLCARLERLWGTAVPARLVFLHPRLDQLLQALQPYVANAPHP